LREGFISPQGRMILKNTENSRFYETGLPLPYDDFETEVEKVERKLMHSQFRKGNLDLSFDPRITNNISPQLVRYVTLIQAEEVKQKAITQKLASDKMCKPEIKEKIDKMNRG
jgi:hypothetical protein